MVPPVAVRVCVGNFAVPLQNSTLELTSPQPGEPTGTFEVLELDLSSRSGEFEWLERALGLHRYSFRRLDWPFLAELREPLVERRAGLRARACRLQNLGTSVECRGRRVFLRNSSKTVRVCFEKGTEVVGVRWLLEQFEKDAGSSSDGRLREKPARQPPAKRGPTATPDAGASGSAGPPVPGGEPGVQGSVAALEAEVREGILEELRLHPRVRSAAFSAAREALLVHGDFEGQGVLKKSFGVPALKRRRRDLEEPARVPEGSRATLEGVYRAAARAVLAALVGAPGSPRNPPGGASRPAPPPGTSSSEESGMYKSS